MTSLLKANIPWDMDEINTSGNSLVVEIKKKIKAISQKTLSDARLSNPRE